VKAPDTSKRKPPEKQGGRRKNNWVQTTVSSRIVRKIGEGQ
jgi:hypothetical protein